MSSHPPIHKHPPPLLFLSIRLVCSEHGPAGRRSRRVLARVEPHADQPACGLWQPACGQGRGLPVGLLGDGDRAGLFLLLLHQDPSSPNSALHPFVVTTTVFTCRASRISERIFAAAGNAEFSIVHIGSFHPRPCPPASFLIPYPSLDTLQTTRLAPARLCRATDTLARCPGMQRSRGAWPRSARRSESSPPSSDKAYPTPITTKKNVMKTYPTLKVKKTLTKIHYAQLLPCQLLRLLKVNLCVCGLLLARWNGVGEGCLDKEGLNGARHTRAHNYKPGAEPFFGPSLKLDLLERSKSAYGTFFCSGCAVRGSR